MHVMPQNCWLQYTLYYIWQDYTFYKINIQFCSTYIQAKITEKEENTIFSKRQQCSYGNGGTLNVPSIMILSYSYIKNQPKAKLFGRSWNVTLLQQFQSAIWATQAYFIAPNIIQPRSDWNQSQNEYIHYCPLCWNKSCEPG